MENGSDGAGEFPSRSASPRRVLRVAPEDHDRPLPDFMARHCPEVPAGFLKKLIRKEFVHVGGAVAGLKTRVSKGQTVKLYLPEGSWLVAPNPEVPYRVVYEDPSIVVVDKPYGVVSEPGIGHKLDTLLNGLVARYGETMDRLGPECDFGMAHRLDRDTSGLLVVARDQSSWRALTRQFRRGEVEKHYLLLAAGRFMERSGSIDLPVGRVRERGRMRGIVGESSDRRARTTYRVLEEYGMGALVEAVPHTGRWHQIRLHFAAIKHPIAGDVEHGNETLNDKLKSTFGLDRLFLHAAHLAFHHPQTNKPLQFSSPLPEELEQLLTTFRLPNLLGRDLKKHFERKARRKT
jgi:23S rRNA pseudouridine1911/1915/1917 synthase